MLLSNSYTYPVGDLINPSEKELSSTMTLLNNAEFNLDATDWISKNKKK